MIRRMALVSALALASGLSLHGQASPWGNIKSWSGTVSVEVTDDGGKRTYSASGKVALADDMMPAGMHNVWPMPGAAALSDPTKAAAAMKAWQAHVVYAHRVQGKDEIGQTVDGTCAADATVASTVQLTMIAAGSPSYRLAIEAPKLDSIHCTGQRVSDESFTPGSGRIELSKPLPAAVGPLSGTQTTTEGTAAMKVTWTLTPDK